LFKGCCLNLLKDIFTGKQENTNKYNTNKWLYIWPSNNNNKNKHCK